MEPEPLERVIRNVDVRLARVEQMLPTLATKAEMRDAVAEAVAPLATRTEMHEAIAAAIAPLATREEMRTAIAEEGERSRRHTNVLVEHVRSDIGLLAEHLSAVMIKLEGR